MATRQLLNDLLASYSAQTGVAVAMESVGGVDAAKRVQAGEAFDLVVLACDAIDKLVAAGHLVGASKVDLVHSGVSVAVPAGAAAPDISSAEAVRQAVLAAPSVSYSTGPSGVALMQLFQRWGIVEALQGRLVQAPPGVPVASLVARGEVALGFQQLSELIHVPGIQVLGPLPPEIQITTTFCAAAGSQSGQPAAVQALLAFLASPTTADAKRRQGMEPA
jgi:molybdate transport system substrate-binding protein